MKGATSVLREPASDSRRPKLVWVIAIGFGAAAVWTLLSLLLIETGHVELSDAQRTYFDNLSILDYGISVGIGVLNLAGAMTLFLLRRVALPLFLTSLIVSVAYACWSVYATSFEDAVGASGLLGSILGYSLLAAICAYTQRLRGRGILS